MTHHYLHDRALLGALLATPAPYVAVLGPKQRTQDLLGELAGEGRELGEEERARVFGRAERALAWRRGSLNNVGMANEMTYSRHYPLLESVYDALGRDLARPVEFFRRVDAIKPSQKKFMQEHGFASKDSVDFIRAYEAEIAGTIEAALAEAVRRRTAADRGSTQASGS